MTGITDKSRICALLEEISLLKELRNDNIFKIRAFANAARMLEGDSRDLPDLIQTGELEKIKGIGKGRIAEIIHEFYEKGKCKEYQDLKKGFPETLFQLFEIPGLGAKKIKALYEKLGIKSVGELEYACKENRLLGLEGFGAKTQENILQNIAHFKKSHGHFLLDFAKRESDKIIDFLKKQKGIVKISVAGSIRRSKEIIRDIDILVTAKNAAPVHKAFCGHPGVESVIARGTTKSSVLLKSGIQCDLRTVAGEEFATALYYFTGSKEHNVVIRTRAKKKGIKINEYGLFKGKKRLPCKTEEDIFERVGLHYIPPEARENTGEIEFAEKKPFPRLVELRDLRGVFHVHSTYSDGTGTLEQMIRKAEEMGLEYIGISDHSRSAHYANGLNAERVRKQFKEIDQLQKKFKIRIFKGTESDILLDGGLDFPEALLKQFDFVIGSVHSSFRLPEAKMTERLKRAMDNKHLNFIGHPTGRLLLGRSGYSLDLTKVLAAAKKAGVVMELNSHPNRLDLDWRTCRAAKEQGVLIGIHPDAHSVAGMDVLQFGVGIARKGWLEKEDVLNTRPLAEIEKFLKKRQ